MATYKKSENLTMPYRWLQSFYITLPCSDEERGSNSSVVTLRNEISKSPESVSGISRSPSLDEALGSTTGAGETSGIFSGTLTRKDSGKDTESIISSGMSSICASPPIRHTSRYNRYGPSGTLMPHSAQRLDDTTLSDRDSLRSSLREYVSRCASASLTNVSLDCWRSQIWRHLKVLDLWFDLCISGLLFTSCERRQHSHHTYHQS